MILILIIFVSITNTKKDNQILNKRLDTVQLVKEALSQKLDNTLRAISKELKTDMIECIFKPIGTQTADGLPLYHVIMRITDSSIIPSLNKVDYNFDHYSYTPKIKSSHDPRKNFSISIPKSYGCLDIVPVYLHYKNNKVDTILFSMCEKARIMLPSI